MLGYQQSKTQHYQEKSMCVCVCVLGWGGDALEFKKSGVHLIQLNGWHSKAPSVLLQHTHV